MLMEKIQEVNGIKIYSLDYLMNNELSDVDLANLLDNDNKGLLYSVIVNMFYHVGVKKSIKEIIKLVTTKDKWMNDYFWSYEELIDFENKLAKVLKNIYYIDDKQALERAQWYIIVYGLKRKGNTIDL